MPLVKLMQDVFAEIQHFAAGEALADGACFVGMQIVRLLATTA